METGTGMSHKTRDAWSSQKSRKREKKERFSSRDFRDSMVLPTP